MAPNRLHPAVVLALFLVSSIALLTQGVPTVHAQNPPNLLANPGFEFGLSGWGTTVGTAVYSVDSTNPHTGCCSVKGVETNNGSLGRLVQDVTKYTAPGNTYVVSGFIMAANVTGGGGAAIDFNYVDAIGATPADGYVLDLGGVSGYTDFLFFNASVTLPPMPADAVRLYFALDFNAAMGTAWWDDLSLICVSCAVPTLSTTLSSTSITVGGSVFDSATLTGATSGAHGNFSYVYFGGSTCSGTPTIVSVVQVTNATVPNSASVVFSSAGSYSWNAVYGGDANNRGVTSACEPLAVKVSPSINTTLSATKISVGTSVHDSAILSPLNHNSSLNPTGSVTYSYYSGGSCSGFATIVSVVAVANGTVPNSASRTFIGAGSFSWNAFYSGDSNYNGATSPCEPLTVTSYALTDVSCSPSTSFVPARSTCTARVLDGPTPQGFISFSTSSNTGTFSPAGYCTLSFGSCSVNYTDSSVGSPTITAYYQGDSFHASSSSSTTLSLLPLLTPPPPSSNSVITGTYSYQRVSGSAWNFSNPIVCGNSTINPQCEAADVDLYSTTGLHLVNSSGAVIPFYGTAASYGTPLAVCQPSYLKFPSVHSGTAVISVCFDEALVVSQTAVGSVSLTVKVSLPTEVTGSACNLITAQLLSLNNAQPVSMSGLLHVSAFQTASGNTVCAFTFNLDVSIIAELASAPATKAPFALVLHEPTTIMCIASPVGVAVVTKCRATVSGNSPQGSITWSSGGEGSFSQAVCQLTRSGYCQVTYRATSGASPVPVLAKYSGDANNRQSAGVFPLTVMSRASRTSISCRPVSLKAGSSAQSTCTATVIGYHPTGSVVWTQTGAGSVHFSSTACTLNVGRCSVTITAASAGQVILTATYGGDPSNHGSNGSRSFTVRTR